MALAGALGSMHGMTSLDLRQNQLEGYGGSLLLPALVKMVRLDRVSGLEPSDIDWAATDFDRPPLEVLRRGWQATLGHLRELGAQGGARCSEVRLVLAGLGLAGKTSVQRALQSQDGRADVIDEDQRTVGVDVIEGWEPVKGDELRVHVWDLGGQTIYESVHSLFLSRRCIYLLVFRAGEGDDVFETRVAKWLRLIHSRVPGAHVLLACTRWCTPDDHGRDLAAHQKRISSVAAQVADATKELMHHLNKVTEDEIAVQDERLGRVRARLQRAEDELQEMGPAACEAPGGHGRGRRRRKENIHALRLEEQEIQARLCALRTDREPNEPLRMSLEGDKVHCIECVGGDGSTVQKLREVIVDCAKRMPFMGEEVPRGWAELKRKMLERCDSWPVAVQRSGPELQALIREVPQLTEDRAWEGLRFWELLGYVLVHDAILVSRPTKMIDFVRPIAHNKPVEALRTCIGRPSKVASGQYHRSEDWVVPQYASLRATGQKKVKLLVETLQDKYELRPALLRHLAGWCDLSEEQSRSLLGVLESFYLIVKQQSHDGPTWLCACRLGGDSNAESASEPVWSDYENETRVRVSYAFDFMPSALFPRFVAKQLSKTDFANAKVEALRRDMLRVRLSGQEGGGAFMVKLETDDDHGSHVVCLASTNVIVLRSLCYSLEELVGRDFVATACRTEVEFESARETGRFRWDVENENDGSSLASLLRDKRWEERVPAANLGMQLRHSPRFSLGEIFAVSSPAFFVSHCWESRWVRFDTLDTLVDRIESRTGERVWFDHYELEGTQDLRTTIDHGVRDARCVIVCLSRRYLASENCLLELQLAREQNLTKGTRIVLIAMEPEMVFEKLRGWEAGVDIEFGCSGGVGVRRVHRHTVQWVKHHLVGPFRINEEWSGGDGAEGLWSDRREAVLQQIVQAAREHAGPHSAGAASEFEVGAVGDGTFYLRDKALHDEVPAAGKRRAANERGADEPFGGKPARAGDEFRGHSSSTRGRVVIGFFPETKRDAANLHGEGQDLGDFFDGRPGWTWKPNPRPTQDTFRTKMFALEGAAAIVLFSGHCDEEGTLQLVRDRTGEESSGLKASAVVKVMKEAVDRDGVDCVMLNVCDSAELGRRLHEEAGVPHVASWKGRVGDGRATNAVKTMFGSLERFPGDYAGAVRRAKAELLMAKQAEFGAGHPVPRERLCLFSTGGHILPGDSEDDEDWGPGGDDGVDARDRAAQEEGAGAHGAPGSSDDEDAVGGVGGVAAGGQDSELQGPRREPVRSATNSQGASERRGFKALGFKLCVGSGSSSLSIEAGIKLYETDMAAPPKIKKAALPDMQLSSGRRLSEYGLKESKRGIVVWRHGQMVPQHGKKHLYYTRQALQHVFGRTDINGYDDLFAEGGALEAKVETLEAEGEAGRTKLRDAAKYFERALGERARQLDAAVARGDADKSHKQMVFALKRLIERIGEATAEPRAEAGGAGLGGSVDGLGGMAIGNGSGDGEWSRVEKRKKR